MTDDPTQVPCFKVTVITESLADGSVHTTVFDKADVDAQIIEPDTTEADLEEILTAIVENRVPKPTRPTTPPKIVLTLQPYADERGIWSNSHIEEKK